METDTVEMLWDVQHMRYHGGACQCNLKRPWLIFQVDSLAVAALTFLIWDTVITWPDEVQYIWP